jgi:ubiquitin-like modifier-activating enzyme ATG7
MDNKTVLQFQSLSSLVDPTFWYSLTKEKIDNIKLSDVPIDVYGYYSYNSLQSSKTHENVKVPSFLQLNSSSLTNETIPPFSFPMKGLLKNTNTIEEFQKLDKKGLFEEVSKKVNI